MAVSADKVPSVQPLRIPSEVPSVRPSYLSSGNPSMKPSVLRSFSIINTDFNQNLVTEICIIFGLTVFFILVCFWDCIQVLVWDLQSGYKNACDQIIDRNNAYYFPLYVVFDLFGFSVSMSSFSSINEFKGSNYQYVVVITVFTFLSSLYSLWFNIEFKYRKNIKVFTYRTDILHFLMLFSLNLIAFFLLIELAIDTVLNQQLLTCTAYNFTALFLCVIVFIANIVGKFFLGEKETIAASVKKPDYKMNLGFNSAFGRENTQIQEI